MSTALTWQTESTSLETTLKLAAAIGSRLKGSEVIVLESDLGGGKTSFVRGLAKGMGSSDTVRSPSFTLSNVYASATLTLHHFDFYRLNEPGIMRESLNEILAGEQNVVAVEWADIIAGILPAEHMTVRLKPTGKNTRNLLFKYPVNLQYLIPTNT